MTLHHRTTVTVVSSSPVDADHPLAAAELAQAVGDHIEWVFQLVEAGLIAPAQPELPPAQWVFHSEALHCALETRRLQRDFDVNLDAAALILDLRHEVRRLRGLMRA